jgi:hypothetical protein
MRRQRAENLVDVSPSKFGDAFHAGRRDYSAFGTVTRPRRVPKRRLSPHSFVRRPDGWGRPTNTGRDLRISSGRDRMERERGALLARSRPVPPALCRAAAKRNPSCFRTGGRLTQKWSRGGSLSLLAGRETLNRKIYSVREVRCFEPTEAASSPYRGRWALRRAQRWIVGRSSRRYRTGFCSFRCKGRRQGR